MPTTKRLLRDAPTVSKLRVMKKAVPGRAFVVSHDPEADVAVAFSPRLQKPKGDRPAFGTWIPGMSEDELLDPPPLTRHVFEVPEFAGAATVVQGGEDGPLSYRTDQFEDGTLVGEFGEMPAGEGAFAELVRRAQALPVDEVIPGYGIGVISEEALEDRQPWPQPGMVTVPHDVPLERQPNGAPLWLPLHAGDVLFYANALGSELPGWKELRHEPLAGTINEGGGHLQWRDPVSGAVTHFDPAFRHPTNDERAEALARSMTVVRELKQRRSPPPYEYV